MLGLLLVPLTPAWRPLLAIRTSRSSSAIPSRPQLFQALIQRATHAPRLPSLPDSPQLDRNKSMIDIDINGNWTIPESVRAEIAARVPTRMPALPPDRHYNFTPEQLQKQQAIRDRVDAEAKARAETRLARMKLWRDRARARKLGLPIPPLPPLDKPNTYWRPRRVV